jgi:superoxide dismutase, Fe-Mn family
MPIELPPLPYDRSALEPHLSAMTLEQHHGRHHRGHVEALNAAIAGTPLASLALDDIVRKAQGRTFEHAAQAWNLAFYWRSMRPVPAGGGGEPEGALAEAIARRFGDAATLRRHFDAAAGALLGAGWAWLVQRRDGSLGIAVTANAATPLTGDARPLLACSLWEHAYYLDYREARGRYLEAFWNVVDWDFAASQLA